jgi:hypothetical protein
VFFTRPNRAARIIPRSSSSPFFFFGGMVRKKKCGALYVFNSIVNADGQLWNRLNWKQEKLVGTMDDGRSEDRGLSVYLPSCLVQYAQIAPTRISLLCKPDGNVACILTEGNLGMPYLVVSEVQQRVG